MSGFDWIYHYQLFLFDMDGLLVNTERIHFQAYRKMCQDRGFILDWDFKRYCLAAHYEADGLQDQIYAQFPDLQKQEPSWDNLYAEKKRNYMQLIREGDVLLMPHAEELLYALAKAGIGRCVVTHSARDLVEVIKKKHPVLQTVSRWYTRDDYRKPKPDPECYQKAIKDLSDPEDRIIGFEDSPRGLSALLGTKAQPVMICPDWHPGVQEAQKAGVLHFSSLGRIAPRHLLQV